MDRHRMISHCNTWKSEPAQPNQCIQPLCMLPSIIHSNINTFTQNHWAGGIRNKVIQDTTSCAMPWIWRSNNFNFGHRTSWKMNLAPPEFEKIYLQRNLWRCPIVDKVDNWWIPWRTQPTKSSNIFKSDWYKSTISVNIYKTYAVRVNMHTQCPNDVQSIIRN